MKIKEYDLANAVVKGCCTPESLAEFKDKVREKINTCPDGKWIYTTHKGYLNAYEGMIAVCGFCSCKLVVLGAHLNSSNLWEVILSEGKFNLEQRRIIGEVSGKWEHVLKLGRIFHEPYQREQVLAYAKKLDDSSVWKAAFKTNCLQQEDVAGLARQKASPDHWGLAIPIIKTDLLTQGQAFTYLASLQNYRIDPAVEYVRLKSLRGQDLLQFAEAVEKMGSEFLMKDFWVKVLQNREHDLDREQVLDLFVREKKRRQGSDHDDLKYFTIAVIKSGALAKKDLAEFRPHASKEVLEALMDAQTAA